MSASDQEHFMDECFAYDDVLRNNGPIGGEALQTVSNHPGLKAGPFEIRPVEDMTEMIRESKRRRSEDGRK
jgi:hypothetical protein